MNWLKNLPPVQRMALLAGVPLVAAVVLVNALRRPAQPDPAEEDTGPVASGPGSTTGAGPTYSGAIGVGELVDMVGTLSEALIDIRQSIEDGEKSPNGQPPASSVKSTVVRPGETWASLTRRVYGSSNWWALIRDHPLNRAAVLAQPNPQKAAPAGARVYTPTGAGAPPPRV